MKIGEKWQTMAPRKKRIAIIGTVLLVLCVLSVTLAHLNKKPPLQRVNTDLKTDVLVTGRSQVTSETLSADLGNIQERLGKMENDMQAKDFVVNDLVNKKMNEIKNKLGMSEDTSKRIEQLEVRLNALAKDGSGETSYGSLPVRRPRLPEDDITDIPLPQPGAEGQPVGDDNFFDEPEEQATAQLRIISQDIGESEQDNVFAEQSGNIKIIKSGDKNTTGGTTARDQIDKDKQTKKQNVRVPAGTIVQGVLLNGLDAPTSRSAQKNPTPALIRVKHDAILPNRYRVDIKECFMLSSGYGVMSTERANMRTEKMSCVLEDGTVLESPIDGYLVGQDGKVGIRGRLVSKQGSLLAKSLVSGLFSGMASVMQPTQVNTLDIDPDRYGQWQMPSAGGVASESLLGGASTAMENVSKFYLDMAEEIFPVIEVDAGRKVTIILVNGANLKM